MIRALTSSSFLMFTSVALASESNNKIVDMSIYSQWFVYMGAGADRSEIEKIYGRTFPINTIFVPIRFADDVISDREVEKLDLKLDLIPYDAINTKKEGDTIALTLNGKNYTIRCKQIGNICFCRNQNFETVLADSLKRFATHANWVAHKNPKEAQESLLREKVID